MFSWKFILDELRTPKVFLLIETLIAKDIWDDNQLWDDIRGLVGDGMVRKRDVRIKIKCTFGGFFLLSFLMRNVHWFGQAVVIIGALLKIF